MLSANRGEKLRGNFMIRKIILSTLVLMLIVSISVAVDPGDAREPGTELANPTTSAATEVTSQDSQSASDSVFLEDFNSINSPYKETLFATGQGKRNESIEYYENLTGAFTAFQQKYRDYRPPEIKSDEQFSGDMENVSLIISSVKDEIYTGNLTEAHSKLEEVRPIFQKILIRNNLLPLSVALVDFHDAMELVLDAANNKDASKVLEAYPMADEKLKSVEAISSDPGIKAIRENLDAVMVLAKENNVAELPAKASDLKASYVKVYLAMR
jgi:hypothetical protein